MSRIYEGVRKFYHKNANQQNICGCITRKIFNIYKKINYIILNIFKLKDVERLH